MPNSYWLFRSRAGFKRCNQAKQQGSIFIKGALLITKMHLQTQPDPFQGPLDWLILLSCSELLPPEILWAGYKSCYMGPLSLFQLSWEFHLSCLLLKCDRAECGPQVFLNLFIEVELPEVQDVFSKPVLGRMPYLHAWSSLSTLPFLTRHPLLDYWDSYTYFSVFALCIFSPFFLRGEHKIQGGGSSWEKNNCPSVSP